MDTTLMRTVTLATAVCSGLLGGTFFGFSVLVMPGLRRLPADQAVRAMQAMNDVAPRSLLMLPLVGSALGSLAVGAWALTRGGMPGRGLLLGGAVAGVAAFVVTAAYHVPRNDALDRLEASAASTVAAWNSYEPGWTAMNHVRAALAVGSAALLVAGAVADAVRTASASA